MNPPMPLSNVFLARAAKKERPKGRSFLQGVKKRLRHSEPVRTLAWESRK